VHAVRWRVAGDGRITALATRLRQDGLVRPARCRRSSRGGWAPTRAGARLLRALRSRRPAGTTGVLDVALGGPARMADAALHARVFDVPPARRTGIPFRGHVADYALGIPVTAHAAMPHVAPGRHDGGRSGCAGG
jgi:hypothetical protein